MPHNNRGETTYHKAIKENSSEPIEIKLKVPKETDMDSEATRVSSFT
jgi:hypothetical protein